MLKKAGIVAAVTSAGLLALAPLAFAGDEQSNTVDRSTTSSSGGLITINLLNGGVLSEGVLNDANVCPNTNVGLLEGVLGLLGLGGQSVEQQNTTCVTYNDNIAQMNDD